MKKIRYALPFLALPLAVFAATRTAAADDTTALRIRELSDRAEITTLVDRLGRALDEGRFDELAAIYTPDATAKTPGGEAPDRAALIAQASRNHAADKRVQHFISNVMVDLNGDSAKVRANLIAVFSPATDNALGAQPQFTLGEVYSFTARRTAQGWLLTRVETSPVWSVGTRP